MSGRKTLAFCMVIGLALASCATNPVTGKKELSLISEQQELALGKQTDGQIRTQYGAYEDPALSAYVTATGTALAKQTHRPSLEYHFAVLDTPVVNAFAVPGGYIYLTRGILALMNSEAEMAVVLGHELGHVNARHSVSRMSKLILVQIGLAVGSALSETVAKISGVAGIGIQLLFLKYSRDDERQADALGIEYSRKGGYNPGEMVSFFASLEKFGDLSGRSPLPGFLSTHPLTGDRIKNVRGMLTAEDERLLRRDSEYLGKIDNILFGDDPRQGYVEGNSFYHPGLRFAFSFPSGWKLQNTPAQVTLVSKDENAAVVLQAEKSGDNLQSYAKKKAAAAEGAVIRGEQSGFVHGFSCFHQVYDVPRQEQETLRIRNSFIKKGEHIFTFSALSTALNFKVYEGPFAAIVDSFAELNDPAHLDRQPQHLRLIRARGGQSLQNIFQSAGVQKDLWPKLAIMNGMELAAQPEPNRLVKIVR